VSAIVDMVVPGKRPRAVQCGDESPRRMGRTEHLGNQEYGLLTSPSWKKLEKEEDHTLNVNTYILYNNKTIPEHLQDMFSANEPCLDKQVKKGHLNSLTILYKQQLL
jgi:hypothetical protein